MKKTILPLLFTLLLSCSKTDNASVFNTFINGYYNSGYESIEALLGDTITITDLDQYTMNYSKQAFEVYYKWDSVFQPQHKIVEFKQLSDTVIEVKQSVKSKRYEFLENNPLNTRHRFCFSNNKITRIENHEYLNADFDVWVAKRDSLVNWIDRNHPDLSGFIFDMTPAGAQNYLKAIELYQNAVIEPKPH